MEQEIWKDIAGYEGLYHVSNLGRVKSVSRVIVQSNGHPQTLKERIMKHHYNPQGYLMVGLSNNGVQKSYTVHRLVAEAFIPNDDIFADTVNHKNEVKTDNRVDNLEWMSLEDNLRYSHRDGGTADFRGTKHPQAKPVRCIETGQVFGCASDASRWLGLDTSAIRSSIRKGCRAGGYRFEYVNNGTK